MERRGRIVIGVTGASGAIYADRLLAHLRALGQETHLVLTDMGKKVCAYEGFPEIAAKADKVYDNKDFFAPISSGSYLHQGMVVLPCSMGTLGKMAHGTGDSLLTRAADVCLKEKRKLIIVPRETPMSALHLENQKLLADYGGVIIPANPSFYHQPATIEDLVDTVLSRVLDHLGLDHDVGTRWRDPK
ncbi:MAG: UbiX family flavin prenyltransferase [Fibrobacteria bacterium]